MTTKKPSKTTAVILLAMFCIAPLTCMLIGVYVASYRDSIYALTGGIFIMLLGIPAIRTVVHFMKKLLPPETTET